MDYAEISYVIAILFYILFCICFVFTTNEFVALGLTIEYLFGRFIKNEKEDFVLHHIQRICFTLLVHTMLPFGFTLLHIRMSGGSFDIFKLDETLPCSKILLSIYAHFSLLLPMSSYIYINYWQRGNYHCHPIRTKIEKFVTHTDVSWHLVAVSISGEFRRHDTVVIKCGNINRVVVTNNWIIKVSAYSVDFARQNESTLTCTSADVHGISFEGSQNVQYLNIKVTSERPTLEPFSFRINALDFNELNDKLQSSIIISPQVKFHKSRILQFLDVFTTFIKNNPKYLVDQDPELCIGCMNIPADVKLVKYCNDTTEDSACGNCQCRPMWCTDCMGKWFALRQDQNLPETWMSSKCTCPMCRTTFCLLDVCLVSKDNVE